MAPTSAISSASVLPLITLLTLYFVCCAQGQGARLVMEPGKYCDHGIWSQLVKPSAAALQDYYYAFGTENEGKAKEKYLQTSNAGDEAITNHVLNDPNIDQNDADKINSERENLFDNVCRGMKTPFLFCRSSDGGKCTCKDRFPFETTVKVGLCKVQLGSICGIQGDFQIGCNQGECLQGNDGKTYFCGGQQAFEVRRDQILKDRRDGKATAADTSDTEEEGASEEDTGSGANVKVNLLATVALTLLALSKLH